MKKKYIIGLFTLIAIITGVWLFLPEEQKTEQALALGAPMADEDGKGLFISDGQFKVYYGDKFKNYTFSFDENGRSFEINPTDIKWDEGTKIGTADTDRSPSITTNLKALDGQDERVAQGVVYNDIWGSGIDIGSIVKKDLFRKIVKIDSLAALGSIPADAETLDLEFQLFGDYIFDQNTDIGDSYTLSYNTDVFNEQLKATTTIEVDSGYSIRGSKAWYMTQQTIEDQTIDIINDEKIESIIEIRGGDVFLVKKIPVSWLQSAIFPVYTDADIFYGNANNIHSSANIEDLAILKLDDDRFIYCNEDAGDTDCYIIMSNHRSFFVGPIHEFETVSANEMCIAKIEEDGDNSSDGRFILFTHTSSSQRVIHVASTTGMIINSNDEGNSDSGQSTSVIGTTYCAAVDDNTVIHAEVDTGPVSAEAITVNTDGSITTGSSVTYESGNVRNSSVCKLDDNEFIIFYEDNSDSGIGKMVVGSTTSQTINGFTTPTAFGDSQVADLQPRCAQLDTNTVAIAWEDLTDSKNYVGQTRIVTVDSDQNETLGTELQFTSGTSTHPTPVKIDTTSYVIAEAFRDLTSNFNVTDGRSYLCTVSGTTPTCQSADIFDDGLTGTIWTSYGVNAELFSSNLVGITYVDDDASDVPVLIIGDVCYPNAHRDPASDFSFFRKFTITAGGTSGGAATTTTRGYNVLATTTLDSLKATSSSGNIQYPDGRDIVFFDADQSTHLDYEIEKYATSTGELIAWVEVNDISSTTAKDFYMYYGNASASPRNECASGAWNDNTVGVWHMEHGTTTEYTKWFGDSADGNDGVGEGFDADEEGTGQIGDALDFDGSDDYVDIGGSEVFAKINSPFSLVVWANIDSYTSNTYPHILAIRSDGSNAYQFLLSSHTSYGGIAFGSASDFGRFKGGTVAGYTDSWTHFVVTYNGAGATTIGNYKLYINGVDTSLTTASAFSSLSQRSHIGASNVDNEHFEGLIDEVRISNIALHSMDILTDYNAQVDSATFLTIGAEQTPVVGDTNQHHQQSIIFFETIALLPRRKKWMKKD